MERWSVGEAGDPIYRAAAAILGIRARVTDCGEIPGRLSLRERRTRNGERKEMILSRGSGRAAREGNAG